MEVLNGTYRSAESTDYPCCRPRRSQWSHGTDEPTGNTTQSDLSFSTALALASGRKSRRGELKATNARVYINKSVSFGRRTGIRKKG